MRTRTRVERAQSTVRTSARGVERRTSSRARSIAHELSHDACESLLARAASKTKRQIEELLVELSPRPDVPSVIRKLPEKPAITPPRIPLRELGPDRVTILPTQEPGPPKPPAPPPARPVAAPLAPSRYKVQFTASGELREKLERLQALMHSDLAEVIEAAVTEKLERLESKRFGKTSTPRTSLVVTSNLRTHKSLYPRPISGRLLGLKNTLLL